MGTDSSYAHPTASEYRLIVEHAPVMIWRSGQDGAIDYFNEAWLEFTGRTFDQEQDDRWIEGIHPDDVARQAAIYRDHFEHREPFEAEYRLRRYDGVYRYIVDRAAPYYDDAGDFAGYIGWCVDVQDRRESTGAKSAYLRLLAHEQRTPLTSLKMYLEALRRKTLKDEPLDETIFARMNEQIDRFDRLITELSDTARIEEGEQIILDPGRTDLAEVVEEVVATRNDKLTMSDDAGRRHVIRVQDDDEPHYVKGDASRLRQLLENLLDNAIKFSPRGGDVSVGLEADADGHHITIRDTGIGIPADEIPSVGQRYFRGSNASVEQYPGLGLAWTKNRAIIERHGGRYRIESTLNEGTAVTVTLPAAEGADR
ncbi:MAG TPA: PAS domain-containing sensor histidine kinase [Gammaproteobacteria bacterium]|nr:PAS domain-containing sensor histidine kinase [Gammaproteobacteria bacterium]